MDCHTTASAMSCNKNKKADTKPARRRQDFGAKNGALPSESKELSKVAMTADKPLQSAIVAQKPTPQTQQIPLIDLHAQYHAYKHEIDSAIARVLLHQEFILGSEVAQLEEELASFVGRRFCISCSSGSSALLLALLALGIGRGDEVITPSFSFIAAAEMIALLGAKPVFVDICPSTYTLATEQVARAITPRTRAIIPVCLFGMPYDVLALEHLANTHGIPIIEDGAQSFGAAIVDSGLDSGVRRSGSFGLMSITSFFPAKPLGGYGDGGAVFVDDEATAKTLRALRNHGQERKYAHKILGLNARLDSLQAAVLRVKLAHFPQELVARENLAHGYFTLLADFARDFAKDSSKDSSKDSGKEFAQLDSSALASAPESSTPESNALDSRFSLPYVPRDRTSSFAQFCLQAQSAESREQIMRTLARHGIATAIHYPTPLHLQEAFAYLGYARGDFPMSERVSERIFSIPFCAFLSPDTQKHIAKILIDTMRI